MNVLGRLDDARGAVNVLEHPFYQRWSAGELSAAELALYAGQYRHAVLALAGAADRAAAKASPAHRTALRAHATEEADHVELWDRFAHGAGVPASAEDPPALTQTEACVEAWTAGEDLLEHLAVLYAIEAGQPEVSRTKLEGLRTHYGFTEEGPALEYFELHEVRDVEHARQARELISELMAVVEDPEEQADRMVVRAHAALRGNWQLLDGVQEQGAMRTTPPRQKLRG